MSIFRHNFTKDSQPKINKMLILTNGLHNSCDVVLVRVHVKDIEIGTVVGPNKKISCDKLQIFKKMAAKH